MANENTPPPAPPLEPKAPEVASSDELAKLRAEIARLSKELETAKPAGGGSDIKGMSESSAHALLEELRAVKRELAQRQNARRWLP